MIYFELCSQATSEPACPGPANTFPGEPWKLSCLYQSLPRYLLVPWGVTACWVREIPITQSHLSLPPLPTLPSEGGECPCTHMCRGV